MHFLKLLCVPLLIGAVCGEKIDLNSDPCYENGRPRRCIPDFVNAAFGQEVKVNSVCGLESPERYCDTSGACHVCDAGSPRGRFPAEYLTDLNNPSNVTCWRSEAQTSVNSLSASPDNVTLTLSLGKKFELTYISLSFCPKSIKPDSLAIYKSQDFGKSWQPLQFYSSQCKKLYGRTATGVISRGNEQEALCTDRHKKQEISLVLQDWVTATDIKVIFNRLYFPDHLLATTTTPAPPKLSGKFKGGSKMKGPEYDEEEEEEEEGDEEEEDEEGEGEEEEEEGEEEEEASVVLNPSQELQNQEPANPQQQDVDTGDADSLQNSINQGEDEEEGIESAADLTTSTTVAPLLFQYAVSDLSIGGRCKCNGHASRCIKSPQGELVCECRHNTAGKDCEKCKPFFSDRPWGRATVYDANECKGGRCKCNGHASRCIKSPQGALVCECRHNTAGKDCEKCKPFFSDRPWGRATVYDANECK
ncbi:netrin-1, partial [Diaphorina citri]|uniref:Netrin-1 n=1 Tax=Diaphorina citri TaxID=121845 RepID=A0A3Q0JBP4_DIACI